MHELPAVLGGWLLGGLGGRVSCSRGSRGGRISTTNDPTHSSSSRCGFPLGPSPSATWLSVSGIKGGSSGRGCSRGGRSSSSNSWGCSAVAARWRRRGSGSEITRKGPLFGLWRSPRVDPNGCPLLYLHCWVCSQPRYVGARSCSCSCRCWSKPCLLPSACLCLLLRARITTTTARITTALQVNQNVRLQG